MIRSSIVLCASVVLLQTGQAAGQDPSSKIYETNYKTPHSKNYRSEDGRGNFNFGFDIEDGSGGGQFRRESGNANGERRGSYGFRGADGLFRVVNWVADRYGYRAAILSNEPGVVASSPADVSYNGAPVRYSSDTQGAPLPTSEDIPAQYQAAALTGQTKAFNAPVPFTAAANTQYVDSVNSVASSNVTPVFYRHRPASFVPPAATAPRRLRVVSKRSQSFSAPSRRYTY